MLSGLIFKLTEQEEYELFNGNKLNAINLIVKRTECRLKDAVESIRRYNLDKKYSKND